MFKDEDIRSHLRSIGLTGSSSITNYGRAEEYGQRDAQGNGIAPHMADLRTKNQDIFTLAHVEGMLKWRK